MTRDWKRLGDAIKARREELGMARQQDLADAAGVTRQSVQTLESGKPRSRTPKTLDAVRKALGWDPETVARYLAPASDEIQNGATHRLADGMPVRVARELSSGQVVDTEIIELNIPGLPVKFVGVLKQDTSAPDLTPEEMALVLENWSRMQRAMRQITDDQDDSSD